MTLTPLKQPKISSLVAQDTINFSLPPEPLPDSRPGIEAMPLSAAMGLSVGLHVLLPLLALLLINLAGLNWFHQPPSIKKDLEFTLVAPTPPTEPPNIPKAYAQQNQKAGGTETIKPKADITPSQAQPQPSPKATETKPLAPKPLVIDNSKPVETSTQPETTGNANTGPKNNSSNGSPAPAEPGAGQTPGIDARQAMFAPYMNDVKRRLMRYWKPVRGEKTRKVTVLFEVLRDGTLKGYEVAESSGDPATDQAAVDALQLSAPFKALPAEYDGESIPILFTFDYTVL